MTQDELILHRKCLKIMQGVDRVIGKTSMNPEIVLLLRQTSKEMLETKCDMGNLKATVSTLRGLELTHIRDKFKR